MVQYELSIRAVAGERSERGELIVSNAGIERVVECHEGAKPAHQVTALECCHRFVLQESAHTDHQRKLAQSFEVRSECSRLIQRSMRHDAENRSGLGREVGGPFCLVESFRGEAVRFNEDEPGNGMPASVDVCGCKGSIKARTAQPPVVAKRWVPEMGMGVHNGGVLAHGRVSTLQIQAHGHRII